jgi:ABC-type transport system involved in cytochrome bd biosynthesis fused ATPase/permease subunit
LVLQNGVIAEKGTHEKLLKDGGKYADMWNRQAKAEKAAKDAHHATRKAEKLMRKANIASPDSSSKPSMAEDSSSSSDESTDQTRSV